MVFVGSHDAINIEAQSGCVEFGSALPKQCRSVSQVAAHIFEPLEIVCGKEALAQGMCYVGGDVVLVYPYRRI